MMAKTYTPAIITKADRQIKALTFEVVFLRSVHDADRKRIRKVTDRDVQLSDELDLLENGFIYGGNKND